MPPRSSTCNQQSPSQPTISVQPNVSGGTEVRRAHQILPRTQTQLGHTAVQFFATSQKPSRRPRSSLELVSSFGNEQLRIAVEGKHRQIPPRPRELARTRASSSSGSTTTQGSTTSTGLRERPAPVRRTPDQLRLRDRSRRPEALEREHRDFRFRGSASTQGSSSSTEVLEARTAGLEDPVSVDFRLEQCHHDGQWVERARPALVLLRGRLQLLEPAEQRLRVRRAQARRRLPARITRLRRATDRRLALLVQARLRDRVHRREPAERRLPVHRAARSASASTSGSKILVRDRWWIRGRIFRARVYAGLDCIVYDQRRRKTPRRDPERHRLRRRTIPPKRVEVRQRQLVGFGRGSGL